MKLKNMAIVRVIKTTTDKNEWLDVQNGIHNNKWNKRVIILVFGIPIFKNDRSLTVDSIILNKEGKPFGFTKPK